MAPMSAPYMIATPPQAQGSSSPPQNNQKAIAGLLRHKHAEMMAAEAAKAPGPSSSAAASSSGSPPPGCPMHAPSSSSSKQQDGLNPTNNIPFNLSLPSSSSSSSSSSSTRLSSTRTVSSIPRGLTSPSAPDASPYDSPTSPSAPPSSCPVAHNSSGPAPSKWEYPSPEQFQAALARKNKAAPAEHVEMMVQVHNFLNEEAWKEVLEWEKHFVASGEADAAKSAADLDRWLVRFQGRPGTLSPRARWYAFLGSVWPSRYGAGEGPFDRHDWVVGRPDGSEARYVIDYYGDDEAEQRDEARRRAKEEEARRRGVKVEDLDGGEEEDEGDQAHFVLDVRPALDSLDAVRVRARRAFREWREGV